MFACFVVVFDTFMHTLKAVSEYRMHTANEGGQQDVQSNQKELADPSDMSTDYMPASEY